MKAITFDNGMRWLLDGDNVIDQIESEHGVDQKWLGKYVPFHEFVPGMILTDIVAGEIYLLRVVDVAERATVMAPTDEQIDKLLETINEIAEGTSHYEYGLPLGFDHEGHAPHAEMRAAVRAALKEFSR